MSIGLNKPSFIVTLMDAHLWNDQTELVDHLFPDVETKYPWAQRWFELKDPSPPNRERLRANGAPVVERCGYAWVGLPADPGVIAAHLQRLG